MGRDVCSPRQIWNAASCIACVQGTQVLNGDPVFVSGCAPVPLAALWHDNAGMTARAGAHAGTMRACKKCSDGYIGRKIRDGRLGAGPVHDPSPAWAGGRAGTLQCGSGAAMPDDIGGRCSVQVDGMDGHGPIKVGRCQWIGDIAQSRMDIAVAAIRVIETDTVGRVR